MAGPRGMRSVFLAAATCMVVAGGAAGWGPWKDRTSAIPGKCFLPAVTGVCRGFFPSYFYNPAIGGCDCFVYGGCAGNDNRFGSLEECARECRVQHVAHVTTRSCRELFDEATFDFQQDPPPPSPPVPDQHLQHQIQHPPQALQHSPQALQHPPQALQHPPLATQHPPQATQHPPLATQHPPLATQHPPLATHHPPLATRHPPLATQHPPLATQHPPLATHSPQHVTAVVGGAVLHTVQPVYSFAGYY